MGLLKILVVIVFLLPVALQAQQPAPESVEAVGYDSHIEIFWKSVDQTDVVGYEIFKSNDGGNTFSSLKKVGVKTADRTLDWVGDEGVAVQRHYTIRTLFSNGSSSAFSDTVSAQTRVFTDEELVDMVQAYTFRYFWDFAHPVSGMARERSNGGADVIATGGSGFGVMAIITGVERGWITRDEGLNRLIQIASFLQIADRYHGAFPHWMNGNNGNTIPFSQFDDGADLVETAFLMQGLLAARAYFDKNTPLENALRDAITGLWEDVEWDWFRRNNSPVLYWHWSPNYDWQMNFALRGFFEAQIVYILAAASPTHPVPGSLYQSGWTANPGYCTPAIYFGYPIYCGNNGGGPLFFAHYSYLGFDPRLWRDACCNYFVRNRNHALIQVSYAKANPEKHVGYGENCWGLTSCDGPNGYAAHDINPANDDGTIAPTAALASMPYTPDQSVDALRFFYRNQGEKLWGPYGFYDAFNLDVNWYANAYIAIDQGPIVAMIENYRSRLFWDLFMQNAEIAPALIACGFTPDSTVHTNQPERQVLEASVFPNPVRGNEANLRVVLKQPEALWVDFFDQTGRLLRSIDLGLTSAGEQIVPLQIRDLPTGSLMLNIRTQAINDKLKPTISLNFLKLKP